MAITGVSPILNFHHSHMEVLTKLPKADFSKFFLILFAAGVPSVGGWYTESIRESPDATGLLAKGVFLILCQGDAI